METRVALIGIIVEQESSAAALNALLHEYGGYIIGRMGLPYRERGVNIISVVLDAPQDKIAALSGKIGRLPGVSAKTQYSNVISREGETDMKKFVSLLLAVLMAAAVLYRLRQAAPGPRPAPGGGRHHSGGRPEGPHVHGPGEAAGRCRKPENRQRHRLSDGCQRQRAESPVPEGGAGHSWRCPPTWAPCCITRPRAA